ncbi:hypothetical protein IAU60_002616 [Kwoniella sp. DSM 27419]
MPELIERICVIPECQAIVLHSCAVCWRCYETHCEKHKGGEYHPCARLPRKDFQKKAKATQERCLQDLLDCVRGYQNKLLEEVERLRPGQKCEIEIPQDAQSLLDSGLSGGFNVNIRLSFDDGVQWLVRIRQGKNHRLPRVIQDCSIRSEAATLNFLKTNGVPVSQAWLPSYLMEDQEVEPPFDYFFCELLPGQSRRIPKHPWFPIDLPEDELFRLISAYAQHQVNMSNAPVPVNKIGCVSPGAAPSTVRPGPIIARGGFQTHKPPYLLGPFATQQERYLAHIDAVLRYLDLDALNEKTPLDAYLWHLELREMVASCPLLAEEPDVLYIKHDDEKGDHFLLGEDNEMVGVVDWEWAYATTKGETFAAPRMFYVQLEFLGGDNGMTAVEQTLIACYENLHRPDLAECVRQGRIYQRLATIGQYTKSSRLESFRELFNDSVPADFQPPSGHEEWRVYLLKRYGDHEGLQRLMERHDWTMARAEKEAKEAPAKRAQRKKEVEARRVATMEAATKKLTTIGPDGQVIVPDLSHWTADDVLRFRLDAMREEAEAASHTAG